MARATISVFLCLILTVCWAPSVAAQDGGTGDHVQTKYRDTEDHMGKSAIEKWSAYGIIDGFEDGSFRPNGHVTHSEMAALIVRLVGFSVIDTSEPYDIDTTNPYYDDVMKLLTAHVMEDFDGYVRPYAPTAREEAVTMIARAFRVPLRLAVIRIFSDWDDISDWAKKSVFTMLLAGYLDHFGKEFVPQQYISRAEVIMLIDAMFDVFLAHPGIFSGTVQGNVIIRSPGVTLRDAVITGDVYIVDGVRNGFYTIDDTTIIEGNLIAYAGRTNPFTHIDPNKPMVALTYDDGPVAATDRVLDALESHGARATFFVVGQRVSTYQDTLRRAVALGCELAGHTWSHTSMRTMSANNLIIDTERVRTTIYETTGFIPSLVRPPFGDYSSRTIDMLGSIGVSMIYWAIDPQDWSHLNANSTYNRVMSRVKDGAIVLLHDTIVSTAAATERLLPELIARGYQLVTVSELLTYSEIGIEPGRLYASQYEYR